MSDFSLPSLYRQHSRTQLLLHDQPFLLLAGEVHNSSSSSLNYMEGVWNRLSALHCNTALVPISWEQLEPVEGEFDFTLVEGLINQAREHDMHLVLLWFGTYKNTRSTYTPAWVKCDTARFPRAQEQVGKSYGEVTVVCEEALRCDARAFAALMRHVKSIDAVQQTVVMVQVENEVGILTDGIDYSPQAQTAFLNAVPNELLAYLEEHVALLHPRVLDPWTIQGRPLQGDWKSVFGAAAWEIFLSWHFARFVGAVAAAGRAEYNLPMFANAWLAYPEDQKPGQYPCGGPVAHMLDIWRAAAPAIELTAPDIYVDDFAGVCQAYTRQGNPLVIPEARTDQDLSAKALYAFGEHGAICYAPFGIEDIGDLLPQNGLPPANPVANVSWVAADTVGTQLFARTYQQLAEAMPVLTPYLGSDRARGILQRPGHEQETFTLGGLTLRATFQQSGQVPLPAGGGIIISPADNEFIVIGHGFRLDFTTISSTDQAASYYEYGNVDFLEIWEGHWENGAFIPGRRLNGDEYAVRFAAKTLGTIWVKLYQYA